MTTKRMFQVTLSDPKKTGGVRVHLPVHRTEEQVEALKQGYANVVAHAVERVSPDERPAGFRTALTALVACYHEAEHRGDLELAKRAQDAVAALLGHQKFLRTDDGQPFSGPRAEPVAEPPESGRFTLPGVGR